MKDVKLNKKFQVGVIIHDVSRLRRRAIDQLLQPLGITGIQWWVLTYISLRPGLSQVRLADELNIGKVALGGLIDRLMKNGLIDRRPDAQDKRVNLVYLSDAGMQLAREIRRISSEVQKKALKRISQEELDIVISVLERMQGNLENVIESANKPEILLRAAAAM